MENRLLQLHRKALQTLEMIQAAKERQRIRSEYAAATYTDDYRNRPFWAEFPPLVTRARKEAEIAPKVVERLRRRYNYLINQINIAIYEESIA